MYEFSTVKSVSVGSNTTFLSTRPNCMCYIHQKLILAKLMKRRLVVGLKFMAISSHLRLLEVPPMKFLSHNLKDHLYYSSHSWEAYLYLKSS